MTLLDAYAVVAFLAGGPASAAVRAILRDGDAAVATANLAEALDVAERVYGLRIARAVEVLEPLLEGPLLTVSLDAGTARRAAEIRAKHYHRTSCPISLADAVLVATAGPSDQVATADPHVLVIADAEGAETIELPGQQ